jgi:hypothetical protein
MSLKPLSVDQAKRAGRYARGLKKLRLLTASAYVVFDWMLWVFRKPGERTISPSIADIVRETGVRRNAVIAAIKQLVGFGLLAKQARYLHVEWGRKNGRGRENLTARRTTNLYIFACNSYESTPPTASTEMDILIARVERQAAAARGDTPLERALAGIAAAAGLSVPS